MAMTVKWTPTGSYSYNLVFVNNSQLRAIAELCAQDDSKDKFVSDFTQHGSK